MKHIKQRTPLKQYKKKGKTALVLFISWKILIMDSQIHKETEGPDAACLHDAEVLQYVLQHLTLLHVENV